LHFVACSFAVRKPNEGMRHIVILFVGGFFGLIIGLSLPPLSVTKVQKLNILFLMYPTVERAFVHMV